jgi:microcystin-dependent protein
MSEDITTTSTTSTITTTRPCDACYNGCVQTVSDECVRYTGINYEALGVETGDNLVSVEQAIMNALVPLLTGTGDAITLSAGDVCALVTGYLTAGLTHTSREWIIALSKGECDLQAQIVAIDNTLAILNANYTIGCLTGVTASSDTHDVLQAVITKLCTTVADLAALTLDVDTNYVKLADLDALIAAYLASQGGGSNQQNLKMVPYVAYEYYGSLTNFDGTGAGLNSAGFYKVNLCNGLNGTPDRRGRVAVGAIQNVPGGPLDAAVNPANTGNPNYAIFNTAGANTVTLIASQMPSHSHGATATSTASITPNPHSHTISYLNKGAGDGSNVIGSQVSSNVKTTSSVDLSVAVTTSVTNANTGGGAAHANIQPVIAAYYIMYIP